MRSSFSLYFWPTSNQLWTLKSAINWIFYVRVCMTIGYFYQKKIFYVYKCGMHTNPHFFGNSFWHPLCCNLPSPHVYHTPQKVADHFIHFVTWKIIWYCYNIYVLIITWLLASYHIWNTAHFLFPISKKRTERRQCGHADDDIHVCESIIYAHRISLPKFKILCAYNAVGIQNLIFMIILIDVACLLHFAINSNLLYSSQNSASLLLLYKTKIIQYFYNIYFLNTIAQ